MRRLGGVRGARLHRQPRPHRPAGVLGSHPRSRAPPRRDDDADRELRPVAASRERLHPGRHRRPLRLRRGRPPPPVRRARAVDVDGLRRVPRRGERPGRRHERRRAGRAQPAPAGGDGRRRVDAGRDPRRARRDGHHPPRGHGRRRLGAVDVPVRRRCPRAAGAVPGGRRRRAGCPPGGAGRGRPRRGRDRPSAPRRHRPLRTAGGPGPSVRRPRGPAHLDRLHLQRDQPPGLREVARSGPTTSR